MRFLKNKTSIFAHRRGLLAMLLALAFLTIGFESLDHNCNGQAHHDPSHCALCTFSLSAAEESDSFVLITDSQAVSAFLAPEEIFIGSLLPAASVPRAPPSL